MMKGLSMGVFICDFELVDYDGDETYVVYPVGLEGATEGYGLKDAVEMAADWLKVTALDYLMRGEEWPDLPLGTEPTRGGRMVTLAVDASLDQVPAVTAAEAARMLGVSAARVAQLVKAGALDSWKAGGTRMVSCESVECRLAEGHKAGRPKRELTTA